MEKRTLWFIRAAVLCVVLAGLCLTLLLSAWISAAEKRESEAMFQQEAGERIDAFAAGMANAIHALNTVNSLFVMLDEVSREQFSAFTGPLLEKYPHVLAFTYQRLIPGTSRRAYERSMRRSFNDFKITEMRDSKRVTAAGKTRYRVVDYVSPLRGNEDVLGVDASSIPEMEEAAARAMSTGAIAATRPFRLVRDNGQHLGFTLLKPVYQKSLKSEEGSHQGKREIVGFTAATFNAFNLAYRIMEQGGFLTNSTFSVQLYVGNAHDAANQIFSHPQQEYLRDVENNDIHHVIRSLEVAGLTWNIVVSAPKSSGNEAEPASRVTLLFGIIFTAVLAVFIYQMLHREVALKSAVDALEKDNALRKSAESALRSSEAELRQLAAHQMRVKEDERKHMAREIHDDLGQSLLVLRMDVCAITRDVREKCPEAESRMGFVLTQIDATIKSTREIINHLRPSVLDLGAYDALQWLMNHMNKLGKVRFSFDCPDEDVFTGLKEDTAISLFRAVQEAMTNVIRHANATSSVVRVRDDGTHFRIEVSDNGTGHFPNDKRKPRSFGLIGIRERIAAMAGEMSITTTSGQGTVVVITIPSWSSQADITMMQRATTPTEKSP